MPYTTSTTEVFDGSLVLTSKDLLILPDIPVVSTVTVITPSDPGGISAELAEAVVALLQDGITFSILSMLSPLFLKTKSWLTTSPSFTLPKS